MAYALARGCIAAKPLGVDLVAPCGLAWQVVRNSTGIPGDCKATIDAEYEQPVPLNLPLVVPDGAAPHIELYIKNSKTNYDKHLSLAGCYLNALVFYAMLFGKSPVGAAAPNASWGPFWGLLETSLAYDDLLALQKAAEGAVKGCGTTCRASAVVI